MVMSRSSDREVMVRAVHRCSIGDRMDAALAEFLPHINDTRYRAQASGHYESFFQRANHPSRPLAFWIRYTLFSPKQHPEAAVGELWAIYFNGETDHHVAVKQVVPLADCAFSPSTFQVQIAEARLATYQGTLVVNGETVEVDDWIGSQNHNWGSKHTDHYAWGQVAGFDTHPDSFLEVATARLKVGQVWLPPLTLLVLQHAGTTWALNSLLQSWQAQGVVDIGHWSFRSHTRDIEIAGTITAPHTAFV